MYKQKRPNIVRNYSPDMHELYDGFQLFHVAGPKIYENIRFISNESIGLKYKNVEYTLTKIDRIIFLMSKVKAKTAEFRDEAFQGVKFSIIINNIITIEVNDDNYSVYKGKKTIIPIAQILANDIDHVGGENTPLILLGISNAKGGTVTINGSNIEFTNTSGEVGDVCEFTYTARNENGDIGLAKVFINIMPLPPIICNPETFDVQQGETILLSKASLAANDVDSFGLKLTVTSVGNPKGGTVAINGDNVSFKSTNISGFPAEFEYTVTNTEGITGIGKVYINVTPLPPIEAYISLTDTDLQATITNGYTPPSVQDIFNTWARYDGANYFANKSTATGSALNWQLLSNPSRISQPDNTAAVCGIISPDKLDNYTFEATLTSSNTDDDAIGLIAAFNRDNGTNQVLSVYRTQGGMSPGNGWGFVYGDKGGNTWIINNISVGGVHKNATSGDKMGWNNRKTRVKIQRQGDIITAWCTNWNDVNNYQVTSKITLDLNSDPRLAQFKGKQSYGYLTYSQAATTYLDVTFKGGIDASKLFDATNNTTWEYINGQWVNTGVTIQDTLGYVREVTNPDTGITYIIKANEILIKP